MSSWDKTFYNWLQKTDSTNLKSNARLQVFCKLNRIGTDPEKRPNWSLLYWSKASNMTSTVNREGKMYAGDKMYSYDPISHQRVLPSHIIRIMWRGDSVRRCDNSRKKTNAMIMTTTTATRKKCIELMHATRLYLVVH